MSPRKLKRIKHRPLERQLAVSLAGLRAGTAIMSSDASSWWMSKEKRAAQHSAVLKREARRFADELGKLKGSYVKIGQMLAMFGNHLLPPDARPNAWGKCISVDSTGRCLRQFFRFRRKYSCLLPSLAARRENLRLRAPATS